MFQLPSVCRAGLVTRQNDAQPDHPFGAAFAANGVRLSHYAEAAAGRRSMVFPAAAGSPVNGNSPQPSSSAGTVPGTFLPISK
jgi:hypothetical protein